MPQRKGPIKQRPKVEDESTGNPPEHHGPHQPGDEGLPGRGGTKGGLNKYSGLQGRGKGSHRHAPGVGGDTKERRRRPKGIKPPPS
jgi:hypothetical protein